MGKGEKDAESAIYYDPSRYGSIDLPFKDLELKKKFDKSNGIFKFFTKD